MTYIHGLLIAFSVSTVTVFVGFIARLWVENVRDPDTYARGLLFFTALFLLHALAPFLALYFALRAKNETDSLREYIILIIQSPFIGLMYLTKRLPGNYNLMIAGLKKADAKKRYSNIRRIRTNNVLSILSELSNKILIRAHT